MLHGMCAGWSDLAKESAHGSQNCQKILRLAHSYAGCTSRSCAYFTPQEPRQLRQIYGQLEENNLFLIQNEQESAEALEAVTGAARTALTCNLPALSLSRCAEKPNP